MKTNSKFAIIIIFITIAAILTKVLKDFTSKVNDLFVSLLSTPTIYTPVTTKASSSSSSSLLSPSPLLASEVLVNSSSIIWQYLRRGEAPPGGRWRSIPIYSTVSSQQPNSLIIVIRQKIFNATCGGKNLSRQKIVWRHYIFRDISISSCSKALDNNM